MREAKSEGRKEEGRDCTVKSYTISAASTN